MGIASCNCIVAFAGIVSPISSDTANRFVRWDLIEQVRSYGCVTDAATGDLDGTYFQCFFINPDVDLAPKAAFGAAMLTGVPFTFALRLDACTVYQKVQGPR